MITTNKIPAVKSLRTSRFESTLEHAAACQTGRLPGKDRSTAANPEISRPDRLHSRSQIPKALSVSLALTPPCRHFLPFYCSASFEFFCKAVMILRRKLAQLINLSASPFCTRSRGLVLDLKVPPTEIVTSYKPLQRPKFWLCFSNSETSSVVLTGPLLRPSILVLTPSNHVRV